MEGGDRESFALPDAHLHGKRQKEEPEGSGRPSQPSSLLHLIILHYRAHLCSNITVRRLEAGGKRTHGWLLYFVIKLRLPHGQDFHKQTVIDLVRGPCILI